MGSWNTNDKCKNCNSHDALYSGNTDGSKTMECLECGLLWHQDSKGKIYTRWLSLKEVYEERVRQSQRLKEVA